MLASKSTVSSLFKQPTNVLRTRIWRYSSSFDRWHSDDNYQYLERSTIPTYHFQPSLQHLPIPKLEKTCERYLRGIRPLLTEAQFSHAKEIVKSFEENEGKHLHEELVKHDKKNKHTSYITQPWFDMYTSSRLAPPINFTPCIAFAQDPVDKYNEQLTRATNMVLSIGRFKRSLDAEVLRPEIFHLNPKKTDTPMFRNFCKMLPASVSWYGAVAASRMRAFPLDMSQHPSLFNTTRIPRLRQDEIFRQHDPPENHFVVMRKGHLFTVQLFSDDGGYLLSPAEVHASLGHILSLKLDNHPSPMGIFTTMERDIWAKARIELLSQSQNNQESISKIDTALFVISLDDFETENPERLIRNLLYGDDGANRWWDKSISFIVHKNGLTTNTFEHSWGDGVAVLRLIEDVYKDTCQNHFVEPNTKPAQNVNIEKLVQKIEFDLNDGLKSQLKKQHEDYIKLGKSLAFSWVENPDLNRAYIRKHRLGPDAMIQLAFQLAFYRMTGQTVATYESCSTSAFKHGRTETMRPATSATKRCVQAFTSKERPSNSDLRGLIQDCSKLHNQLVKNASLGQGFDRHLLGLKVTAQRLNEPIPKFYTDETFQIANRYVISTSTLSTDTIIMGGFGPVVPDGLGIGYNVVNRRIGCVVSAYEGKRDPKEFTHLMQQSFQDLYDVLEKTKSG